MKWTEYDPATGRIKQALFGTQLVQPLPTPESGVLDGVAGDPAVAYVFQGTSLAARPATTITLAQAGNVVTLSGVKFGIVVYISGAAASNITQDANDGQIQLTFTDAGQYSLDAEQFPELPFSATVII